MSRNKLLEVPSECTKYKSLERLLLYHNTIKSIPDNITSLKSLMYLDIRYGMMTDEDIALVWDPRTFK